MLAQRSVGWREGESDLRGRSGERLRAIPFVPERLQTVTDGVKLSAETGGEKKIKTE